MAATAPPPVDPLYDDLARLLRRVSQLHLRISLARLAVKTPGYGKRIAAAVEDPRIIAGALADGSVVVALLGPRPAESGDDDMAARIRDCLEAAVRRADLPVETAVDDLAIAHCWSDEVHDVPALVLDLAMARARPSPRPSPIRRIGRVD